MKTYHRRARTGALAIAAALLVLTGCASAAPAPSDTQEAVTHSLTIEDAWVKAAPDGMTAAFGILTNDTDEDITVVSAETTAAERVELHETVPQETGEMAMQEKQGGFVIPAGGTLELAPGGSHLMLMGLPAAIEAGEEVSFTLTLADDATMSFTAAVKDFTGANENYSGDHDESSDSHHSEHDQDN